MPGRLHWTPTMINALNKSVAIVLQEEQKHNWNRVTDLCEKLCGVILTNKQCRNRYINFASKKFQEFKEEDKKSYFELLCQGKSDSQIIKQLQLQQISPNSIKKFKKAKKNTLCKDLGLIYKNQLNKSGIEQVIKNKKYHYRVFSILFETNQLIYHYRKEPTPLKLQDLICFIREYFETKTRLDEVEDSLRNKIEQSQQSHQKLTRKEEILKESTIQKEQLEKKLKQKRCSIHNIIRPMLDVFKDALDNKTEKLVKFRTQCLSRLKYLEYILTEEPHKVRRNRQILQNIGYPLGEGKSLQMFDLNSEEFHFTQMIPENETLFGVLMTGQEQSEYFI